MSGGSYGYLYCAEPEEITQRKPYIEMMVDHLHSLGYRDAAEESLKVLLVARQAEIRISTMLERLRPVWKAVEWNQSGDWSFDEVEKAMGNYRGDDSL